jgi:DNA-binding MarR family transcriptional regulator
LAEQVLLASRAIRRALDALLAPAKLDGAEFLLLWNIADGRERSQAELADRLGCSNAQVSQLSEALRRRGLLAAERDARDRRRQHWTLTDDGRLLLAAGYALLQTWCDRLALAAAPLGSIAAGDLLARLAAATIAPSAAEARQEAA